MLLATATLLTNQWNYLVTRSCFTKQSTGKIQPQWLAWNGYPSLGTGEQSQGTPLSATNGRPQLSASVIGLSYHMHITHFQSQPISYTQLMFSITSTHHFGAPFLNQGSDLPCPPHWLHCYQHALLAAAQIDLPPPPQLPPVVCGGFWYFSYLVGDMYHDPS